MILKAAILQKDSRIVYVGKRHGDCFKVMQDAGIRYKNCVQGFVDSEGNFFDRHQAYDKAIESGQIVENNHTWPERNVMKRHLAIMSSIKILTSEDLY
jgi:hypothetical protein